MHSNIHCNAADIVDTALYIESEGCVFESLQLTFFHTFLRLGLYIGQNINNFMFLLLLFLLFLLCLSSCCIKVKQPFHNNYTPVICKTTTPARESRAIEPLFNLTLSPHCGGFDELEIPRQAWLCNVNYTRLRGKAAMGLRPDCCPHSVGVIAVNCRRKV